MKINVRHINKPNLKLIAENLLKLSEEIDVDSLKKSNNDRKNKTSSK
ncbi:hypothetical protein [Bacillus cereus]|nr:hypothetical protein [Bacillus cereus]